MKATFFLSLFLLFFCTTTLLPQSACPDQQQKWYMNYYEVDFTSGTPVISPTPYAPPPPSTGTGQLFMNVANGFHDTAGNLLLYTVWKYTNQSVEHYDIYNGIGVQIGNILSVQGYSREMEIIPFECSGNNYFLIVYVSQNFNTSGGNSLAYVIVDIANSLVSSPYFFDDAGNSGYIPTFAVSQKHLDGTFDLYSNIKKEVKKYIIDFSQCQISHEDIIRADLFNPIFYTDNQNIETSELELSPSGNKLTFAQRNSNVVTVIEIDANGNSSAPNQYLLLGGTPFQDRINGLEFNKDGTKLFVNYESSSTSDGVYVLDIASGIFGNVIPNTSDYARSQLEMGPDCYLYAGNYFEATDENRLARIDPSNESLVSSYLLPGRLPYQVANAQYNSGDGIFTLPDLIDCTGQACMNTAPPCTNRCLDWVRL